MPQTLSTAAQVIVTIIPIVGIVMGSVVIFLYLIFNHKQKIAMIEKGLVKQKPLDLTTLSLFSGLVLIGVGLSLSIFYIIKEGASYGLLSGLIPLSIGISLLGFFLIKRKLDLNKE
jgi:hypothetical protein